MTITDQQRQTISELRSEGYGSVRIGAMVGLKRDVVRRFIDGMELHQEQEKKCVKCGNAFTYALNVKGTRPKRCPACRPVKSDDRLAVPSCRLCGVEIPRHNGRGKPRAFCSEEHGREWREKYGTVYARTNSARNCECCGKEYRPRVATQRFCSQSCNSTVTQSHRRIGDRTCLHCERTFLARHSDSKYCSHECSCANQKKRAAERDAEQVKRKCAMCGNKTRRPESNTCSSVCARRLRDERAEEKRKKDSEERPQPKKKSCDHCGEPFTTTLQSKRFCSLRCTRKHGKRNRKARERGQYVSPVSFAHIYKRDRGICRICGCAVDKSLQAPNPLSPSLDHIVPLAGGGTHEPANVQLAHFLCNSLKSDNEDLPTDFPQRMRNLLASHSVLAGEVAGWQQTLLFG